MLGEAGGSVGSGAAWTETAPTRRAGEEPDGAAQLQGGGGSSAGFRAGGEEARGDSIGMGWGTGDVAVVASVCVVVCVPCGGEDDK